MEMFVEYSMEISQLVIIIVTERVFILVYVELEVYARGGRGSENRRMLF